MSPRSRHILICLGLSLLTLACLSQVCGFDFVNLDDPFYVVNNPEVQKGLSLESVRWAWTTFHTGLWQPLTWMSLQLDADLYGYSGPTPGEPSLAVGAWGFHTTNLVLHLANVLLIYRLLWLMTGTVWRSALVAALFAIHPMQVESVAWITERKDVLSAFFFLLALLTYVRHVRRPGISVYLLLMLLTFFGMASKPMLVTLPAVLLLLDYWPLGRLKRDAEGSWKWIVLEKVPLFAMSLLFSILTMYGHNAASRPLALEQRIAGAVLNYGWYLQKTFWPSNLGVLHEYEPHSFSPAIVLALILLVGATIMAVQQARSRPEGIVGWLWFVGMLFPVSGLFQVGAEERACRYTYLPHVGLFIWIVWEAERMVRRTPSWAKAAVAAVMILVLGGLAWRQASYWKDTPTLLSLVPQPEKSGRACMILSLYYADRQDYDNAIDWCRKALDAEPNVGNYHYVMALLLAKAGKEDMARAEIERSLQVEPDRPRAHLEASWVYEMLGEMAERDYHEQRHLELHPEDGPALKEQRKSRMAKGRE